MKSPGQTDGERFLAEKDRLIAEFEGFRERAEALEQQSKAALLAAVPEGAIGIVMDAERRADEAFGPEKRELLSRRRKELFVLFTPDPDDPDSYIERRRGRLQASEKQWRLLFLERHELRVAAVDAIAKQVARDRAAARAVEDRPRAEMVPRSPKPSTLRPRKPVYVDLKPTPERSTPKEVPREEVPAVPKPSKSDLFARLLAGQVEEGDATAYEALVFAGDAPEWAVNLRAAFVGDGSVELPDPQVVAMEDAFAAAGQQQRWLLPYALRASELGLCSPVATFQTMQLLASVAGTGVESRTARLAGGLAERLEHAVEAKSLASCEKLLNLVPAGSSFSSQRKCAEWLVSALRVARERLARSGDLEPGWLAGLRERQVEEEYVAAVRKGDHKALLACCAAWALLDERDPVPHLIEALVHGSLSSKGSNAAKSRAAARRYDQMFSEADDAAAVSAALDHLRLTGLLLQLGLPKLRLADAIVSSNATYAFPQRSTLESKVRSIGKRIRKLDGLIQEQKDGIAKQNRQRRGARPNERIYIDGLIRKHEERIERMNERRAKESAELTAAQQALGRMNRFTL